MPVKKAAQATPNYLLRRARQERGWSQQEVAERIGAPQSFLVTRWERGTALPSAHYRQMLCELFGKSAIELGLIQVEPVASMPLNPLAPIFDPAIPLPLAKTHALIGRDALLIQLKQNLCNHENVALTALNGIPGVGKTALAVALANDPDVQEYFRDGILWVGLGPEPNVIGLLSLWGKLLGMAEHEMTSLRSGDDWAVALHALIGKRQMLLIIDDAWTIEDALTFKTGGLSCTHLLTTRQPAVATRFAGEQAVQIQELDRENGFLLLSRLAPSVIKAGPEEAWALVQAVGGLPLALTLMGNYLSVEARHQQRRRIRGALIRLQQAEERLRLEQPQAGLEHHSSLMGATPLSLQAVIGISANYLDDAARHALRILSLFPAKPNTFSEDAALAVCNCPVEVLDALVDAGLIECVGPDRYTLHQTISNYARVYLAQIAIADIAQKLVEYMVSFVQAHESDRESLELESANCAGRRILTGEFSHRTPDW